MAKRKRKRTGPMPTSYAAAAKAYKIQLKALMMMVDLGVLPARYTPESTHILETVIWPIWGVHELIKAQTAHLPYSKKVKLFLTPFGLQAHEKYAWGRYENYYKEGQKEKLTLNRIVNEIWLYKRIRPPQDKRGRYKFINDIKNVRRRVYITLKRTGQLKVITRKAA